MTSTLTLQIASKTHIGRVREMNQDSFAIFRRAQLLDELDALIIVADGMGGGKGGDVASRIVAETLPDVTIEVLADGDGREPDAERILKSGIQRANNLVRSRSVEKRELEGMGTTCTAAILNRGKITVGHAGDSRIYLLREGQLRQVTDDHSLVWQEVLAGKMTRDEAQKSKFRNQVTKSVGLAQEVEPDAFTFALEEGDTLLFCSDGLTTEVSDGDIAQVLAASPDPQSACDRLTDSALEAGGSDNITVIVVRYGAFRPIANAVSVSPVPERSTPPFDLPEDATDERSEWRNSLNKNEKSVNASRQNGVVSNPVPNFEETPSSRNRSSKQPVEPVNASRNAGRDFNPENGNDDEDDFEEAPRRERTRRKRDNADEIEERAAKGGGFLLILCVMMTFATIGMGIALTVALGSRTTTALKIAPPTASDVVADEGLLRTDKALQWQDPQPVFDKPVRDDFLFSTPGGNVMIAHPDGKLFSVSQKGEQTPLPGPALPKVADKVKPDALTAYDLSGNRYQYDAKTKKIVRYDASGAIVSKDIGGLALVSPTRLTVSRRGDIYILDEHRLKRLESYETNEQTKQDNLNRKNKGSGTDP